MFNASVTTMAGIDVSNFQGTFDWAAWRGKIAFAFAKATEGVTFTDPDFSRNWAAMKGEGLIRGAYHFGHPAETPDAEAAFFLGVVRAQGLRPGDLLALDLETADGLTAPEVAAWADAWVRIVHAATGASVVVYTDQSMARGGYCAGLGDNPLWLAVPGGGGVPMPVGPWNLISFEQTGSPGSPPVDADIFFGAAVQLDKLAVPEPPHVPPHDPAPAPAEEGFLVLRNGAAGAFAGRAVSSHDGGKIWQ
jgi:lysozyme